MCKCDEIKEEIKKFKSDEYSAKINSVGTYTSLHLVAFPNEAHKSFIWKLVSYGEDTAESNQIMYCPFCGKKL